MRVIFKVVSTGGGKGAARATRYIAERDMSQEEREYSAEQNRNSRALFSEDRDDLSYRKADRILDP